MHRPKVCYLLERSMTLYAQWKLLNTSITLLHSLLLVLSLLRYKPTQFSPAESFLTDVYPARWTSFPVNNIKDTSRICTYHFHGRRHPTPSFKRYTHLFEIRETLRASSILPRLSFSITTKRRVFTFSRKTMDIGPGGKQLLA